MVKSFLSVSTLVLVFLFPTLSFAQTAGNDSVLDGPDSSECISLDKNLTNGLISPKTPRSTDANSDGEVSDLQTFLKEYVKYKGVISGTFGSLTKASVKVFQLKKYTGIIANDIDHDLVPDATVRERLASNGFKLSGTGNVWPYTRAKIKYVSCHVTPTTVTSSQTTTQAVATTPATTVTPPTTAPAVQYCPDGTLKPTSVISPSTGCENHEYKVVSSVSNSTNPSSFIANGVLYNDATYYGRLTGVSKSVPPKGCTQPVGGTTCQNVANYRDYSPGEWLSETIIQTTDSNLAGYPLGNYEHYVVYPEKSPMKVGGFTLSARATAPAVAPAAVNVPAPAQNLCPDGLPRETSVAGPMTGCERKVVTGYHWELLWRNMASPQGSYIACSPEGPGAGSGAYCKDPDNLTCNASNAEQTYHVGKNGLNQDNIYKCTPSTIMR